MVLDGHCAPVPVPGFRCDAGVDWVSGLRGGVKSPTKQKNSSTPCQSSHFGESGSSKGLEETENSRASRFRSP